MDLIRSKNFRYEFFFLLTIVGGIYCLYIKPVIVYNISEVKYFIYGKIEKKKVLQPHLVGSNKWVHAYDMEVTIQSSIKQTVPFKIKFDDEITKIVLNSQSIDLDQIKQVYGHEKLTDWVNGYRIPLNLQQGKNQLIVSGEDYGGNILFAIIPIVQLTNYISVALLIVPFGFLLVSYLSSTDAQWRPKLYIAIVLLLIVGLSFRLVYPIPGFRDEGLNHYPQILAIQENQYKIDRLIPMIPGFHIVFGLIGLAFDRFELSFLRMFALGFSIISILVAYLIAKEITPNTSIVRTAQYTFLPNLFPLFFVLYTDAFALLFVLLSMYALLKKQYNASAFLGGIGILIRQNNVIWLALTGMVNLYEKYQFKINRSNFYNILKDNIFLILVGCAFIAFVVINKGVTVGAKFAHSGTAFHQGNIYFLLFVFFFVFLPYNVINLPKVIHLLRSEFLLGIGASIFFTFFLYTFELTHPWQTDQLSTMYLHNRLLQEWVSDPLLKSCFAICVIYSALSIAVTPMKRKVLKLILPLTLLYLGPVGWIQPRYYVVPFALFVLFKEDNSKWVETLTTIFLLVLSLIHYYILITGQSWL